MRAWKEERGRRGNARHRVTERSDGAGEPAEEEVQEQSSDGFPAGGRSRRR